MYDEAGARIYQDGLGVHGALAAPLAHGGAGGQDAALVVEVVGAAPGIGTALGRVGEDLQKRVREAAAALQEPLLSARKSKVERRICS